MSRTAKELRAIEAAARQSVRYELWNAQKAKQRPGDRVGKARGWKPFPEPTGDDVLEKLAKGDVTYWCELAFDAMELANDEAFRAGCGMPEVEAA